MSILHLCFVLFVLRNLGPYVATLRNWKLVFEWCMARLLVENRHQNDKCHYEIGLRAQTLVISIQGFIASKIGKVLCDYFKSK